MSHATVFLSQEVEIISDKLCPVAIADCQRYAAFLVTCCKSVPLGNWHIWCHTEHISECCGPAPLPCSYLAAMLVGLTDICWCHCWRNQTNACYR